MKLWRCLGNAVGIPRVYELLTNNEDECENESTKFSKEVAHYGDDQLKESEESLIALGLEFRRNRLLNVQE